MQMEEVSLKITGANKGFINKLIILVPSDKV